MQNNEFSKPQLITIAVALLNGDTTYVDREEVAITVNDIAPGRFNWRKYPERIDLDAVSVALRSAKKTQNGGLVVGNNAKGWMLSPTGLKWIKTIDLDAIHEKISIKVRSTSILANQEVERKRLRSTRAYELFISGKSKAIALQDFYEFARVNEYFQTKARHRRYAIIANTVIDDNILSRLWDLLQTKFPKEIQ
ncbi:hypothetical protein F4009_16205 [Candidatus Poribacteria bacterium]|nr:hypothetical protein [Candidatus Poribacteria bacterium]MYH79290.1 hypothetical protein [Candidatus Poribacteria bacterium]MYK95513.1 hypothetical protein [Candidatus Poribacteria bacterium]